MNLDLPAGTHPVVFGEVLFDHFADGSRVLGGAPFNVAWHLQGFGLEPLVVTAVGSDPPGEEALERMRRWGMRTDGVQVDQLHPTGRVAAKIVDGEPTYEIGVQQAYDYIDPVQAGSAVAARAVPLVYHGTLALRGDRTWSALDRVRQAADAPTFVDLNLRAPWWTLDRLRWCLGTATWLKLSREELSTVTGASLGELADEEACFRRAREVARRYDVATVLVTRGADGSLLLAGERMAASRDGTASVDVVDTVGAGDGFSAVACIGVLERWSGEQMLRRGNAFAAELCGIRGATTDDRSLYERHRERWRAEA
ncbi:MAG TPA: PfkB family carbohydrate kinase [Longimicrobiales bacterium]|nr:PfkB family carbohydrate kinase [Longimicrobiales bacterium]